MNPAPSRSSTVIPLTLQHARQRAIVVAQIVLYELCFRVSVVIPVAVVVVVHRCFTLTFPFCPASALDRLLDLLVFLSRLDRLFELSARGKLARRLGRFAHGGRRRG